MPHDEIAVMKLLRSRGLRVTRQRLLVLDAICEGAGHSTVPDVVRRARVLDDSIDQSTVHRTLDLLCKLGLVAVHVDGARRTVYEIVGATPHHHLVCRDCGTRLEVPHQSIAPAIAPLLDSVARTYGFVASTKHLVLEGLCERCRKDRPD